MKMSQLHRVPRVEKKSEESSAPTDYVPQHPVLDLPSSAKMSQEDHLDTYTEVNPYKLEEMEDAEFKNPFSKLKAFAKNKLDKHRAGKASAIAAAQAEKIALAINKLASKLEKLKTKADNAVAALGDKKEALKEEAETLISNTAVKHKIDKKTLKTDIDKHLSLLGRELVD